MFESNGFIFPFTLVRPNLYYKLVSNSIEVFVLVALASLIEGHWHTDILILFMMYFNPSNVYSLL